MPGGTPGYGVDPTTARRKPCARSAFAIHADEIWHHVGDRLFCTIDEEFDACARSVGRRLLSDHDVGWKRLRPNLGNRRRFQAILREPQLRRALRLPFQRRHDGRARPCAEPETDAALCARRGAGGWILTEDVARRNFGI